MTNLETFLAYAAAFEQTYADDNWQRLEPFFAEDATYEVSGLPAACKLSGRDQILRGIKKSLDGFDRRMSSRQIIPTAPPSETGNAVTLRGLVRYQREGVAPVELQATIVAELEAGKIRHMHDAFTLDGVAMTWLRTNAADLDGSYV
jgi:hypothetical protein